MDSWALVTMDVQNVKNLKGDPEKNKNVNFEPDRSQNLKVKNAKKWYLFNIFLQHISFYFKVQNFLLIGLLVKLSQKQPLQSIF